MTTPRITPAVSGFLLLLFALFLCLAGGSTLRSIDRYLLSLKCRIAGPSAADPSIVIVALDGEEIAKLGGLPLRRSDCAALLHALRGLNPRAVAFDCTVVGADSGDDEGQRTLTEELAAGSLLFVGAPFGRLVSPDDSADNGVQPPPSTIWAVPRGSVPLRGADCRIPGSPFIDAITRFGHTNIVSAMEIPAFLRSGSGAVAALPIAMAGALTGDKQPRLSDDGREVTIGSGATVMAVPLDEQGCLMPRYAGGTGGLNVIRAAGLLNGGSGPDLTGKIAFVGIVDAAAATSIATPFDERFPRAGVHATLLDNILHGNLLRPVSRAGSMALAFCAGIIVLAGVILVPAKRRPWIPLAMIGFLLSGSLVLFVTRSVEARISPSLVVVVVVGGGLIALRPGTKRTRAELDQRERELFDIQRSEKETVLRSLERRRDDPQTPEEERTSLHASILCQAKEIESLRLRANDLRKFEGSASRSAGRRKGEPHDVTDELLVRVGAVAGGAMPVLISGEPGINGEQIARALHQQSGRTGAPFIVLHCSALSETALEGELFGYEQGAFAGAVREQPGKLELAGWGTVFLEEIGATSDGFQRKLLRVITDGLFERVGGIATLKSDARLVVSSTKDLAGESVHQRFSGELYARLKDTVIAIPPLRSRPDDIPRIVAEVLGTAYPGSACSVAVMHLLGKSPWKGNDRELESVVRRAALLARAESADLIRIKHFPKDFAA